MISREQAEAAGEALMQQHTQQLVSRKTERAGGGSVPNKAALGLVIGMSAGILIGAAAGYLLTGRYTPGTTIGQGFGMFLGCLIGARSDGKISKRFLAIIFTCVCFAVVATLLAYRSR